MIKQTFLILCLSFGFSAWAQTIAKIGSTKISKPEFEKSYKQTLNNSRALMRPPTRQEHLEDMIRFKLGLKEAKKSKLAAHPTVKKSLELALYKGLLEIKLSKEINKIKVSENEMRASYKKNPHIRSSHIFIRFPQNPTPQQVKNITSRANKVYAQILAKKKKWPIHVENYSDDESTKTDAGDLGYHGPDSLYPAYYAVLKSLKIGDISKPFRGLFGLHIVKKTHQLSFQKADKNAIKITVFNKKRFKILNSYFNSLKKKYGVSYNKGAL